MYFTASGPALTDETVRLAAGAAKERGIGQIVVASYSGATALKFLGCGLDVICAAGAGCVRITPDVRERLAAGGVKVFGASHVLSGVERGISSVAKGMYPAEIMAWTLRMFGQGMKVCVEVATMALDAGLLSAGERAVAVGGTESGADTAVIITPAPAAKIMETRIHEIICKPAL